MFDFFYDTGNYDDRKVDRSEFDWGFVSTARVSDGSKPYETGIMNLLYHTSVITVEAYDTKEDAIEGHKKWVKIMNENPPDTLTDCCNADISSLGKSLGCDFTYKRMEN